MLAALARAVPDIQSAAPALDRAAAFPEADTDRLTRLGALDTMEMLRLLGRGNLSLGRLFEAHVNAIRLVLRHGTDSVQRAVAAEAAAGHLFGLWVTDPPAAPVWIDAAGRLHGSTTRTRPPASATR